MDRRTQYILDYLNNQMDQNTKSEFERQIEQDEELKHELEKFQNLMEGVKRSGQREAVKKGFKSGRNKTIIRKSVIGTVLVVTTIVLIMAVKQLVVSNANTSQLRYELNESNQPHWVDADRYLESQIFKIKGNRDTVIETRGGLLLSIPADNFIDATAQAVLGEIEIEVKEALNPLDIMKAGLTTLSNGNLLETGGMFYINARQDGQSLSINKSKGIHARIPELNPNKKMMLFDGQRLPNGEINWINPRLLENKLSTVDIMSLDFYPPYFLDTLQKMGYDVNNRYLTDSIYYSFVCAPRAVPIGTITSKEHSYRVFESSINHKIQKIEITKGEKLFKQNCSVCHSEGTEMLTGPGLAGIKQRVPKGNWLIQFILNNEKLIKNGDVYANKIFRQYGKAAMTVFEGQLTEADVNTIIEYLDVNSSGSDFNAGYTGCEIAPYRIQAIHNKAFNGTLLATKAFEERLQIIFKTCNPSLLELYSRNLEKKMYQLDSMAGKMLSSYNPGLAEVFYQFYIRGDGGVDINDLRIRKLEQYLLAKQTLYKKAAIQTLQDLYNREQLEREKANGIFQKHQLSEIIRINSNFSKELELNLKEAYRQVGKEYRFSPPPADRYLSTTLLTTGWKNLDAYVSSSTVSRETLNYKDPQNGKQATIRYDPIHIQLEHAESYDRVMAYMLPGKGLSFQLMQKTGSDFTEKLNELLEYDVFIIGFKGSKLYSQTLNNAKQGQYKVSLAEMTDKEKDALKQMNVAADRDIWKEIEFQIFSQGESLKQEKIRKREEIREKLWPVIFPCKGNGLTDSLFSVPK